MFWVAIAGLTIILAGGLARVLQSFRNPNPGLPDAERLLGRQQMLSLGVANIAGSIVGFFFLFTRIFGPLAVVLGVFGVTSLIDIAIRFSATRARS